MADKTAEKTNITFSKQELMNMTRFANRRDALQMALDEDARYTLKEAQTRLDNWLKGKVT